MNMPRMNGLELIKELRSFTEVPIILTGNNEIDVAVEARKIEWKMEAVSIEDVIDQATAATSSLFGQKGLTLMRENSGDMLIVTGDGDKLIQVVINLFSNAVKFTDSGSVKCRAENADNEIKVSVADTGIGISEEDQPKVFDKFKQVGNTLTDKPKGTGLGLPICKEIIQQHHGRIWVESSPGEGSTFSFTIPAAEESVAEHP
jgi:signal transduction histidine kinase